MFVRWLSPREAGSWDFPSSPFLPSHPHGKSGKVEQKRLLHPAHREGLGDGTWLLGGLTPPWCSGASGLCCHQRGPGLGDPLLPLFLPSVPRVSSMSCGKPTRFAVGGCVLAPGF